jgi:hypothetical protein
LILPEQLLGHLTEWSGEIIDFRPFIKSADELDIPIPPSISRGRYGAIDITDIAESATLIKNLIESGEITAIIENGKVEQNIISSFIVSKLHNHKDLLPANWRNLSNRKISYNVFIDSERQRQYLKLLKMLSPDPSSTETSDRDFLFNTDFLSESAEDGLSTFKGALREHPAKVVIFDAESVWDGGSRSIAMLKSAIRHCIANDIAVIVILRDGKFLRGLPTPDRLIHIWKKGEDRFRYIVETESDHGDAEVEPFELWAENSTWESETVSPDVLSQIPERENHNKKPGIDTSMKSLFDDLPAGDMP